MAIFIAINVGEHGTIDQFDSLKRALACIEDSWQKLMAWPAKVRKGSVRAYGYWHCNVGFIACEWCAAFWYLKRSLFV